METIGYYVAFCAGAVCGVQGLIALAVWLSWWSYRLREREGLE